MAGALTAGVALVERAGSRGQDAVLSAQGNGPVEANAVVVHRVRGAAVRAGGASGGPEFAEGDGLAGGLVRLGGEGLVQPGADVGAGEGFALVAEVVAYSHVTLTMEQEIADSLQTRWLCFVAIKGEGERHISHRSRIRS